MKLSEELTWRGFVGQTTFDDLTVIDKAGLKFYLGVDPSADSMTIGNLAAMILVAHFMRAGHKGILLAGGATGRAGGDPDGKDETRAKKTDSEIDHNVASIQKQFSQVLSGEEFETVNNYDWFKDIPVIDFLEKIGWHFSMTQLLDRDFVQKRIGEGGKGLNFAEFSYSLIQGYDFLHLFRTRGVTLQLCGVDQFGNCVSGMQMIRKIENSRADVFGMPLVINKSTGKKFGKSEGGAVWLDPAKTSPFKFYQFWLNADDAGVIDYMKIYTFLSKEEIEKIAEDHAKNPSERLAQKTLAYEVTKMVHGEKTVASVERVTKVLFSGADFSELTDEDLANLANEIPTVKLDGDSKTITQILVESEIAKSNGEARRLIEQNAISMNGVKITSDQNISEKSLIKKGKNQFVLVV
ncbi:MAG: tyrosine--tRNA ligase [Candidatus Nomurabacteria bacterium]|jgi:tyrosyl-tRNA synthetase|nr:tyrosine--tRNA ligase [Candidatus Nomurabacteria bacterium]